MGPRLQHCGFSIKRPDNYKWCLYEKQQDGYNAVFWYMLLDNSTTHQFSVHINLVDIKKKPDSPEEMAQMLRRDELYRKNQNREVLSYDQKMSSKQGQWCLLYNIKYTDTDNPASSKVINEEFGYTCIHPSFDRTVLNVLCGQRGTKDELDPELTKEAQIFIDGIILESSPGMAIK